MKMNILQTRRLVGVFALTATILMASGCGGSSSSSDGDADSTVVSRGLITGFGSVYVNGIRFHTGGTQFSIDDDSGVESDLRVGMIVTVKGSKNDDGVNGHATHISYDNELKGPVASIVYDTPDPANATMATMVILGQSTIANLDTTIDDDGGLTFDNIQVGDVLEVNGFAGTLGLIATHMELQADDSEIEIKGHIDDNSLTPNSFSIKGFPVSYDDTTELDDLSALANGLLVEVKGQLDGAGTTLIAREIEGEHEGLDGDMDDAEIQGAIYDFDFDKNTFKILDQRIDATGAELYPSTLILANDLVVEAEGHIIDGILYADEVKQKGKKIKVYATLSAVEADSVGADSISFNFNSADIITAQVNHQTELEDDITDTDIVLSDLSKGDFVEMEAFDDGSGVINAVEIERKNPDEIRIVAPVDGWDADAETVTLLGVVFNLRGASYENEFDQNISVETFYNSLSLGEFVKIKDTDSNGVFDKAELDD
jgi:molybdopterin-guanine dinucleotide biosynthesis protein